MQLTFNPQLKKYNMKKEIPHVPKINSWTDVKAMQRALVIINKMKLSKEGKHMKIVSVTL